MSKTTADKLSALVAGRPALLSALRRHSATLRCGGTLPALQSANGATRSLARALGVDLAEARRAVVSL